MSSVPIGDHALLSNCQSAALLSREGSVEWLCFPRFDSPSVFGRLLDDRAGHWSVHPVGEFRAARRYLDDTMVLETTFTTSTGSVKVVDALAMGRGQRGHHLGAEAPSLLIRKVKGEAGLVELETEYVPRTEYGLIWPLLTHVGGGIEGRGGADITVLTSPVDLERRRSRLRTVRRPGRPEPGIRTATWQVRRALAAGLAPARAGPPGCATL